MSATHPHLPFRRNWSLTGTAQTLLNRCAERIRLLARLPLLPEEAEHLHRVYLIKGTQATTAIEGNTLTEADIERILAGKPVEHLHAHYLEQEVRNMLDAFATCLKQCCGTDEPGLMTDELLLNLHRLVGKDLGEVFEAIPGQYRTTNVHVGTYRPPESRDVPELMQQFWAFMAEEFHYASGRQALEPALVQAIVAHVYIELIHPFGDGNGRTGRLLEFWLLLRGGVPATCAHLLANHYNLTRSLYYQRLKEAGQQGDWTAFIDYALAGLDTGLQEVEEELIGQQWRMAWQRHVYQVFDRHEDRFPEKPRRHRIRQLALLLPQDQDFAPTDIPFLSPELLVLLKKYSMTTLERDVQALLEVKLLHRSVDGQLRLATDALSPLRTKPQKPNSRKTSKLGLNFR